MQTLPTIRRINDKLAKLATMSRPDLVKLKAQIDECSSEMSRVFINAGRGFERPSEIRTKDDVLAKHWCFIADHQATITAECERRMAYQGTLLPIKRST